MKRLAILEEEKRAADKRIEEEYVRRLDNEDKYYLEKREVLLEAITEIQEGVYGRRSGSGGESITSESDRDDVDDNDENEDNEDNDNKGAMMQEESGAAKFSA